MKLLCQTRFETTLQ